MDSPTPRKHARGEVCVVGSINADLTINTVRLPQPGQTVRGSRLTIGSGGKSANQAVAAARLGASVSLIGAVGDDEYGNTLLCTLAREGINITHVRTLPSCATGTALITVDEHGENTIVVSAGANGLLGARDIEAIRETLAQTAVVGLAFEIEDSVLLAAAQAAHHAGVLTVLNPSPYRSPDADLLSMVDLVVLNEYELAQMAGADRVGQSWDHVAHALFDRHGIRRIVVTLGAQGAVVLHQRSPDSATPVDVEHIAPIPVRAVDTTGCGDAFLGVILAGIASGATIIDSAHAASAAAAYAATRPGTQSSYATRSELHEWLDDRAATVSRGTVGDDLP
ncbi:ribokinase [Saccharopolyspora sp. K220]|uniref:ribokinase n=1 Tax=Saccharopolyspora soli TaxID=2926618 RepID=UPI001F5AB62F|nr:ribokinase [Saccharopolyspora soli]MCI2423850.1 ribokinase [Saccharopolyspora soli]